jgi:hypothetical protein
VPSWANTAEVSVTGFGQSMNSTGSLDFLEMKVGIAGIFGGETFAQAAAGAWTFVGATNAQALTGLSGGSTFTVTGNLRTLNAAWSSNNSNGVQMAVTAVYTRV